MRHRPRSPRPPTPYDPDALKTFVPQGAYSR
ncbi:hypothetical protein SSTG_05765 [Streptomyces sp. e14]|nr:hypothetical protein SSTG_05765 [Streptomyces sp. e14]